MENRDRQNRHRRLKKQFRDLNEYPIQGIKAINHDQDYRTSLFLLAGAIDSPYEGFWFRAQVDWPEQNPFRPPKIIFLDQIWNPYVDEKSGIVCADILKDQFCPALTTHMILQSIMSLLAESKITQDHDGFMNPKAASQIMNNYPFFCQQATKYCQSHSFKKEEIYNDSQREKPQHYEIKAEGDILQEIIKDDEKNPEMMKKELIAKSKQFEK